jgi:hypothetical protein
MTHAVLKALTRDDIATILAAIDSISGEERRARAEGEVVNIDTLGLFRPTVLWANRVPPERDQRLIGPLGVVAGCAG